jgi:ssDNA-binding replication factor A large subunit
VTLGDETGIVKAFLRQNHNFEVGNTIRLKYIEAALFKGHIQIRLMDNGKIDLAYHGL